MCIGNGRCGVMRQSDEYPTQGAEGNGIQPRGTANAPFGDPIRAL